MKGIELPSLAVACASAAGTWLTLAGDVALQLFGVPLTVLLAALTGACGVRVFLPPSPFWRAVAACAFWTLTGAILAQAGLWLATLWLAAAPPSGVLAGAALLIASLGQRAGPIVWERGGAALARFFDGRFKKGGEQ